MAEGPVRQAAAVGGRGPGRYERALSPMVGTSSAGRKIVFMMGEVIHSPKAAIRACRHLSNPRRDRGRHYSRLPALYIGAHPTRSRPTPDTNRHAPVGAAAADPMGNGCDAAGYGAAVFAPATGAPT